MQDKPEDPQTDPSRSRDKEIRFFGLMYGSCLIIFLALIITVILLPPPEVSATWLFPVAIGWLILVVILAFPLPRRYKGGKGRPDQVTRQSYQLHPPGEFDQDTGCEEPIY